MALPALTIHWPPMQVIISIDPTQQQEMEYWKQHNPEAYSMVEGAAEKLKDRCEVQLFNLI
jgi:hypothetical protein